MSFKKALKSLIDKGIENRDRGITRGQNPGTISITDGNDGSTYRSISTGSFINMSPGTMTSTSAVGPMTINSWPTTITTAGSYPYVFQDSLQYPEVTKLSSEIENLKSVIEDQGKMLSISAQKIEQLESMIPELFESIEHAHEKIK